MVRGLKYLWLVKVMVFTKTRYTVNSPIRAPHPMRTTSAFKTCRVLVGTITFIIGPLRLHFLRSSSLSKSLNQKAWFMDWMWNQALIQHFNGVVKLGALYSLKRPDGKTPHWLKIIDWECSILFGNYSICRDKLTHETKFKLKLKLSCNSA